MMCSNKSLIPLLVPLLTVGLSCSQHDAEFDDETGALEGAAIGTDLVIDGNNGKPSSAFPLGICRGECDSDADCANGLKCFMRDKFEPVPGCTGTGKSGRDYCYKYKPVDADPGDPPSGSGRKIYHGPWGGKNVTLRDVWKNNWSQGLSSGEKYLLVSNNDCSQSSVKSHAQANGFSVLAQEGENDSGATLLKVQGNYNKNGLKAILDVGKITITAVTTTDTLVHERGGKQDGEDPKRQAFGSTDNTDTGGGVYHLDINASEDGVTIWDKNHPCRSFRGGFMYLRWQ